MTGFIFHLNYHFCSSRSKNLVGILKKKLNISLDSQNSGNVGHRGSKTVHLGKMNCKATEREDRTDHYDNRTLGFGSTGVVGENMGTDADSTPILYAAQNFSNLSSEA